MPEGVNMADIEFNSLPTMIGAMPQIEPAEACGQVVRYLKDVPAWPQLPRRSYRENMYVQFSEGFPGITVDEEKKRIFVDRSQDLDKPLGKLYAAYLENDADKFGISAEYAAGLHRFLSSIDSTPLAVKGQVTGPVSWGLTVPDSDKKPVGYDDVLADAAARMLRLKAVWQEKQLQKISKNIIIFIDEPYINSFGSAFFALTREKVVTLLEEVLGGISGVKGIHCCGNTDWPILLGTSTQILSFDAYNYAQSLSLYPAEIAQFIARKGTIAWGIVPNEEQALLGETVASLQDRLEEAISPFTRKGIPFRQLIRQSLLTPSCTLSSLTPELAGYALEVLNTLSDRIRRKYS
jgi:hypothetical protein